MKQILIEKYIKPSEVENYYEYVINYWFDKYGYKQSFMGQPAEVWYWDGMVLGEYWYKNGKKHRERGLPAVIWYDDFREGEIIRKEWHKKGELKK